MSGIAADQVWAEKAAARRQFEAAASTFASASFIHDEARQRLLERLDYFRIEPASVLDLGSGNGSGAAELARRFPTATVLAVDSSAAMLQAASGKQGNVRFLQADAEQLPLVDDSVELLFANLVLPWCHPERLLGEAARVLRRGGVLMFSSFGPDTLAQLRRAWAQVDNGIHVHAFLDMLDLGDLLGRAGLTEPVIDVDRMTVTYDNTTDLMTDLRSCGARNVALGRPRSLTSRGRWLDFERCLQEHYRAGKLAVTVELIFGQAWGRDSAGAMARSDGEVAVPISEIGRA
jgi:malonyl-CoA O-methyltransferase